MHRSCLWIVISAPNCPGNLEIIPIMISIEIPFPMPLSVILSPSHIQKIVPEVKMIIAKNIKTVWSMIMASLGMVPLI